MTVEQAIEIIKKTTKDIEEQVAQEDGIEALVKAARVLVAEYRHSEWLRHREERVGDSVI